MKDQWDGHFRVVQVDREKFLVQQRIKGVWNTLSSHPEKVSAVFEAESLYWEHFGGVTRVIAT